MIAYLFGLLLVFVAGYELGVIREARHNLNAFHRGVSVGRRLKDEAEKREAVEKVIGEAK